MDFDNPKVYGDTSIFDGLVSFFKTIQHTFQQGNNLPLLTDSN